MFLFSLGNPGFSALSFLLTVLSDSVLFHFAGRFTNLEKCVWLEIVFSREQLMDPLDRGV